MIPIRILKRSPLLVSLTVTILIVNVMASTDQSPQEPILSQQIKTPSEQIKSNHSRAKRFKRSFAGLFDFDKLQQSFGGGGGGYNTYPSFAGLLNGPLVNTFSTQGLGNGLGPETAGLAGAGTNPYYNTNRYNNRYSYYGANPAYYSTFYSSRGFGFH